MRILYGVVGEGMGHATRSRVVLEHLLASGHEVRVVVSGRAHGFLSRVFAGRPKIEIEEIHGLTLTYKGNAVDVGASVIDNLEKALRGVAKNLSVYRKVAEGSSRPQVVISDFESLAYLYGIGEGLPVVSIDNMQIINRCTHTGVVPTDDPDFQLAKAAVKVKLPLAYHYLIATFFFPRVRKKRTTLVPLILRPEILAAKREPKKHVLVYQTATSNTELVPILRSLPYEFRVYGLRKNAQEGNVTLCDFAEQGFIEDLRTARAVIAGGGFSLMGEAVHLGVPMLSLPIDAQYEQELNARYLAHLGYGAWGKQLSAELITKFLERTDDYAHALASYPRQDNRRMLNCVDTLLDCVTAGVSAPRDPVDDWGTQMAAESGAADERIDEAADEAEEESARESARRLMRE